MTDIDEWAERVSERSGVPVHDVIEILEEEQIPRLRMLPARHRLRVLAVHFAGVKNARVDGSRQPEAFSFTHTFVNKVSAFMTRKRNLAGKSAILDVILWAVRGQTSIPDDVRGWLRQAAVELRIDQERFVVIWNIDNSVPRGWIVQLPGDESIDWGAIHEDALSHVEDTPSSETTVLSPVLSGNLEAWRSVGSFAGEAAFKSAVADLVGGRLGFERAEVFQRNRHGDRLDGKIVTQDWAKWSQGLFISGKPIRATIGEEPVNSALLLQMYIGTAWGPAAIASKARLKAREAAVATDRRRSAADEDARSGAIGELTEEERNISDELAKLGGDVYLDTFDALLEDLQTATTDVLRWEEAVSGLTLRRAALQQDLSLARADEVAAREAMVTKRFWHMLKPTCCPRCDTVVHADRWAREESGQCSLCDSDLDEIAPQPSSVATDTPSTSDENHDEVELTRERVTALKDELSQLESELLLATQERETAGSRRVDLLAAQPDPGQMRRRRELSQSLAMVRGRIEERGRFVISGEAAIAQERVIDVLRAAEKEAKLRSDKERSEILGRVSHDILDLARQLGFIELEKTKLDGGTKLPVWKGSQESVPFGSLREGEKLRLKIALLIALLRTGEEAGIGRHPGLLIIDSIGREEMNVEDIREVLEELVRLAEQFDIQVITTSAQGERLIHSLPAGSVRLSREHDDFMW